MTEVRTDQLFVLMNTREVKSKDDSGTKIANKLYTGNENRLEKQKCKKEAQINTYSYK